MTLATAQIDYGVRIGDLQIAARDTRSGARILRMRCARTMDGIGGWARLVLLLGEAQPPEIGAPLAIELDGGEGPVTVFTGAVRALGGDPSTLWVEATDGLRALAGREYFGAFAASQAGAIARAILAAGGVLAGEIEDGPTLDCYVLHRGPTALAHLQGLARRCGLDLFTDGAGGVCLVGPATVGRTRTLRGEAEILKIGLERREPTADGVVVVGEGAASTMGSERAHWLIGDLSSVTGEASFDEQGQVGDGGGERPRSTVEGALRTGEVVQAVARAQATARAARRAFGSITMLGEPALGPGDEVDIEDTLEHYPGLSFLRDGARLRVRGVCHRLDPRRGFTTEVEI